MSSLSRGIGRPQKLTDAVLWDCHIRNKGVGGRPRERLVELASEYKVTLATLKSALSRWRKVDGPQRFQALESDGKPEKVAKPTQPNRGDHQIGMETELAHLRQELDQLRGEVAKILAKLDEKSQTSIDGGPRQRRYKKSRRQQLMEQVSHNPKPYEDLAKEIGCSISAVRNAALHLRRQGKVLIEHRTERRGMRSCPVSYVRLP